MPVFNKRNRDDKGTGRINLDGDTATEKKSGSKTMLFVVGGVAAVGLGLAAVFALSGGDDGAAGTDVQQQLPQTVEVEPPAKPDFRPVPQRPQEPVVTVQSERDRVAEKLQGVYNQRSIMHEAFVSASNRAVSRGSDFSYHVAYYNDGGSCVLATTGLYAGTRTCFLPRTNGGTLTVTKVGAESLGEDNRTMEYHALSGGQQAQYTIAMGSGSSNGSGVNIPATATKFKTQFWNDGGSSPVSTIAGEPGTGLFEVEMPNGDVYQIDLNKGAYYADSLFMNYAGYDYGKELQYDRNNYQRVKDSLPAMPALQR